MSTSPRHREATAHLNARWREEIRRYIAPGDTKHADRGTYGARRSPKRGEYPIAAERSAAGERAEPRREVFRADDLERPLDEKPRADAGAPDQPGAVPVLARADLAVLRPPPSKPGF